MPWQQGRSRGASRMAGRGDDVAAARSRTSDQVSLARLVTGGVAPPMAG